MVVVVVVIGAGRAGTVTVVVVTVPRALGLTAGARGGTVTVRRCVVVPDVAADGAGVTRVDVAASAGASGTVPGTPSSTSGVVGENVGTATTAGSTPR